MPLTDRLSRGWYPHVSRSTEGEWTIVICMAISSEELINSSKGFAISSAGHRSWSATPSHVKPKQFGATLQDVGGGVLEFSLPYGCANKWKCENYVYGPVDDDITFKGKQAEHRRQ